MIQNLHIELQPAELRSYLTDLKKKNIIEENSKGLQETLLFLDENIDNPKFKMPVNLELLITEELLSELLSLQSSGKINIPLEINKIIFNDRLKSFEKPVFALREQLNFERQKKELLSKQVRKEFRVYDNEIRNSNNEYKDFSWKMREKINKVLEIRNLIVLQSFHDFLLNKSKILEQQNIYTCIPTTSISFYSKVLKVCFYNNFFDCKSEFEESVWHEINENVSLKKILNELILLKKLLEQLIEIRRRQHVKLIVMKNDQNKRLRDTLKMQERKMLKFACDHAEDLTESDWFKIMNRICDYTTRDTKGITRSTHEINLMRNVIHKNKNYLGQKLKIPTDNDIWEGYTEPNCKIDINKYLNQIREMGSGETLVLEIHHPFYRKKISEEAEKLGFTCKSSINDKFEFRDDSKLLVHSDCGKCTPMSDLNWINMKEHPYKCYKRTLEEIMPLLSKKLNTDVIKIIASYNPNFFDNACAKCYHCNGTFHMKHNQLESLIFGDKNGYKEVKGKNAITIWS